MLAIIVVILEIIAFLLAIYTMININTVCNEYLKHQKNNNVSSDEKK